MSANTLIRHYVQHGDLACTKCRAGFDAYWIERKPTS